VRAISRDANVAEEMYQKAKKHNIQIVPADIPDLCALDPNPVQTFIRRVMFAMTELEKNLIVQRLSDGRQRKKEQIQELVANAQAKNQQLKIGQLTQDGKAKSCGSKSILHQIGPLSTYKKHQLQKAILDRDSGKIGWRKLQKKMSSILNTEIGSHETARRIAAEFQQYC